MEKLKVLSRHELKHDIDYLNTTAELKGEAARGDKAAKKYIKLKEKHENVYEEKLAAEEAEIARIKAISDGETMNISTAEPSIFHIVNYLSKYFVRFLPTANCLGCNNKLVCKLKEDPKIDVMRPEKSYCMHWMHYECFENFVHAPPFLRECPHKDCKKMFGSNHFKLDEANVKSREKNYMSVE